MPLEEQLKKLKTCHSQAIRSLDAYHRAGAGTKSAQTHYARYEKNSVLFDQVLAEIQENSKTTV